MFNRAHAVETATPLAWAKSKGHQEIVELLKLN